MLVHIYVFLKGVPTAAEAEAEKEKKRKKKHAEYMRFYRSVFECNLALAQQTSQKHAHLFFFGATRLIRI